MTAARPDGGWGYVVALAAFMTAVIVDGVKYSFGILFLELLNAFRGTKSATSWIISIQIGSSLLLGPVTGALVNRFGCRRVAAAGTILGAAGFLASAFANSLWYLYVTFGLIAGLGFGMTSLPAFVTLVRYFDKHLATATGFAAMGSGVGTIVFSPLIKVLIDEYTWRGTMMIEAGIVLNGLLCAAVLLQPPEARQQADIPFIAVDACADNSNAPETGSCVKKDSELFSNSLGEIKLKQSLTSETYITNASLDCDVNEEYVTETNLNLIPDKNMPLHVSRHSVEENNGKRWISLKPLANPGFVILISSGMLVDLSLNVPFAFIPDLMVYKGFRRQDAVWVLFITGILSTVARVSVGFIADRKCVNRVWLCIALLIITGILAGLCPFCETYTAFLVFAVLFGFAAGGNSALRGVLLPDLFGIDMIADFLGILSFFSGIAALIGLPIAGALFDASGTYVVPFIVAGAELVLSGILVIFIPLLCSRHTAKHTA